MKLSHLFSVMTLRLVLLRMSYTFIMFRGPSFFPLLTVINFFIFLYGGIFHLISNIPDSLPL